MKRSLILFIRDTLEQEEMHRTHTRRIDYRIVNIHQPHVRPIVRGKESAKVEFGSKLQVSVVAGYTFIDYFSWEAFKEGGYLLTSVEKYKGRFGFYPGRSAGRPDILYKG